VDFLAGTVGFLAGAWCPVKFASPRPARGQGGLVQMHAGNGQPVTWIRGSIVF
jgi:hypothetical protein